MALRHIIVVIAGVAWIGVAGAQESTSSLIGRWQYIQSPDNEGEVLDISLAGGRYHGIMNGLERAGEHGLFYYVVELTNLTVASDGSIRFTVGARSFFTKRPALSNLGGDGDSGGTREQMRFYGRTEGADLVLKCEDPGGSCPDSTLRFKRVPTTLEPNAGGPRGAVRMGTL